MTRKEVARIKDTIEDLRVILNSTDPMIRLHKDERIDIEARVDALVWVLVMSGNAEGLDPSLRASDFEA